MKKIIFFSLILFSSLAFAKNGVAVSILPQMSFVQKIAKDKIDVTLMVEPGSSPHSYEPKASQMVALSKAKIYFSIGVEFENVWLPKFKSQNPNLRFVSMNDGVSKIEMAGHNHHEEEHHHHGNDGHKEETAHNEDVDPHTWTSPKNVKIMAQNIYKTLAEIDPINEKYYKRNLNEFIKEINITDAKIKSILKDLEPKAKFMVFHPSWGYFANEYNLIQIAVEVNGKHPKPREMIKIIEEAKEENVRVIFTQPEFSDKSARIIAKEAKVKVIKTSPLSAQWSQNLINMAKAIAKK